MPRGKPAAASLPDALTFTLVEGQPFVRVREAAKLAGVHPVVIEMGQKLLAGERMGQAGAAFALATAEHRKNGDAIAATFKSGLARVAKAFKPGQRIGVKVHREGDRLVFWYVAKQARAPRAASKG